MRCRRRRSQRPLLKAGAAEQASRDRPASSSCAALAACAAELARQARALQWQHRLLQLGKVAPMGVPAASHTHMADSKEDRRRGVDASPRAQRRPVGRVERARERRRLVGVRLAHLGHVCVASGGAHPRVRPCAAPADGAATAASPPAARAWPNTSQGCAHGARRAPLPLPACSASCRTGRCGRTSCPSDRVAGLSACRRGRSSAPAPCAPPSGRRRARGRRARRAPAPCAAPGESTHMPSWKESAHARSSRAQGCKALYVTGCCKLARTAPVMHAANEQERGAITHAAERLLAATRRAPAHGQA